MYSASSVPDWRRKTTSPWDARSLSRLTRPGGNSMMTRTDHGRDAEHTLHRPELSSSW